MATKRTYRSSQGKSIDLGALLLQNETVRAVGNMGVNARGDRIDHKGTVVDSKVQQVKRQYNKQIGPQDSIPQASRAPVAEVTPPAPVAPDPYELQKSNAKEVEALKETRSIEDTTTTSTRKIRSKENIMATVNYDAYKVKQDSFRALRDDVIVEEMEFGERKLSSGIIMLSDDGKGYGIRPRWGKVYAIGPKQDDVTVGQWICVDHGRWTRGVKITDDIGETIIRKVDNKDILLVSDEDPGNDGLSTALHVSKGTMGPNSKFYKGD